MVAAEERLKSVKKKVTYIATMFAVFIAQICTSNKVYVRRIYILIMALILEPNNLKNLKYSFFGLLVFLFFVFVFQMDRTFRRGAGAVVPSRRVGG